jgi:glutamate/tyrosine decarboxylase-like PLP-dependent enzyme
MNPLEISLSDFRKLVAEVSELATSYLETLDSLPTFPSTSGEEAAGVFSAELPESGMGRNAVVALHDVARLSRRQNARFFGYVLGSGEPVGAAADLLASVINQNVTAWRSGPAAVTIERTVVGWLAEAIGCSGFQGSLTGGGSPANLMGLAMAREARLGANEKGVAAKKRGVVYASQEAHMSIPKSVALLGLGRENLRLIPCDGSFRMITAELESAMQRDAKAGYVPVAIVANAGTVNTGAIDPLEEIAGVARSNHVWMHVDGAYGALAAIAERGKFAGLELADSMSLDPHKWLYQPLDCGCLLYRDSAAARVAFSHTGDYAKSLNEDPVEGFALFEESMELSRRFRALKLWLSLRYHGLGAFRRAIANDLSHAQRLAAAVREDGRMELMAPVELSAVCFRVRSEKAGSELDDMNAAILRRLIQRGKVYLSNATLHGTFCLRACFVNHRTTDADVDRILPEVCAAAADCGFKAEQRV